MFPTVRGAKAALRGARSAAFVDTIVIDGEDLTDAVFRLEVRDRRDGGELRAGLDTVASAGAEGVRVVSVDTSGDLPVTTLGIRINETTMEAMPGEADGLDPGEDVTIWWGMHITDGGLKFLAFDGPFTVEASTPA